MQVLQQEYDKYLAQYGSDDPLVKSLRAKLEAADQLRSESAIAVDNAKQRLELLLKHMPDDAERIEEARTALDDAKLANGSKESDCFQSAENTL